MPRVTTGFRASLCALAVASLPVSLAGAGQISLNAIADATSVYHEYYSGAFSEVGRSEPTPNGTVQPLYEIADASKVFANLDTFPHDNQFQLGHLEYDDSSLANGYGTVPITHASIGINENPDNPNYLNWSRFTNSSKITFVVGQVTLFNHVPVDVQLAAQIDITATQVLGSSTVATYTGQFLIEGNRFDVDIAGAPFLHLPSGLASVSLSWLFHGKILGLPTLGDATGNDVVDVADYTVWADHFLNTTTAGAAVGDFNLDGFVDAADYTVWADHFKPLPAAAAAAVPEPASWTLVLTAAASLFWFVRGRSPAA